MAAENILRRCEEVDQNADGEDHGDPLQGKTQLGAQHGNAGQRSAGDGRGGDGKHHGHDECRGKPCRRDSNAVDFRQVYHGREVQHGGAGFVNDLRERNAEIGEPLVHAVFLHAGLDAGGKGCCRRGRGKADDKGLCRFFEI